MQRRYAVGGWVPRTKIHLREFFDFVEGNNLSFGNVAGKKCRESLNISTIEYCKRDFDYVKALNKDVELIYTEDGLFYVIGKNENKLINYYNDHLMPSLAFLYSKGAPIPKLMAELYDTNPKPIVRIIDNNVKIFKEGQKELPSFDLFEYVVFFEEYKSFFEIALKMHRLIWEEINKIRDKRQIRYKDLPKVRDSLLDIHRDITFIKSRIKQLDGFMSTREKLAPKGIMEQLKKVKEYNFETLRSTKEYFKELFNMTERHADTTLTLVQTLYQENEQNELATLQIIFIIGVVASILALGAMPNSTVVLRDITGNIVLQGGIESFNMKDLVFYGILTLILGGILYNLMHFFFKSAKRFKLINFSESLRDENDDSLKEIKKIVS